MGLLLLKLYFSNVGYWLPFVLSLVDKWLKMSIFYTSGKKNDNILYKWLKMSICYIVVGKMSIFYTSG